jgi:TonB family protein
MRAAGARLVYWQLLLAACLLLPWVRPWHREVIAASVSVTTVITSVAAPAPEHSHIAPGTLLLYLFAAGVVVRLAWLGVGLWRLRRYRRRAWPLAGACAHAEVLLSAEVSSPVTFGWRRPVILLPERFPQLSEPIRQAILCHENLHVARHDWLFTVAEELVRAALWFHPAIWWLLAEIQLAREQAVDARVVGITRSRDPYVDALLEMAGARPELELSPAPLFLRKRHLKQRVVEIVREATMSKTRWISALAASVVFLAGACWLVTGAFPLAAEPQMATDGAGGPGGGAAYRQHLSVSADRLMVHNGVTSTYSPSVIKRITVSGISDSAKADLLARLPVHEGDTLPAKFSDLMNKVVETVTKFDAHLRVGLDIHNGMAMMRIAPDEPESSAPGLTLRVEPSGTDLLLKWNEKCEVIADAARGVLSISDGSRQEHYDMDARQLRSGSIVYSPVTGDVTFKLEVTSKNQTATAESVRSLRKGPSPMPDGTSTNANRAAPLAEPSPQRVLANGNIQPALISRVEPVYPPLAKQAHVQGTVDLSAIIGKDGHVQDLKVVRGHPLLVQAALDAVNQWVYKPTLMNGEPVEIATDIQVNFALPPDDIGATPRRIRVGGNVEAANVITQVAPHYPAEAKQAGLQGTVKLQALIGKDGTVQDLQVLSGEPVLADAAVDAVRQWVYKPTLLAGEPVEVQTTIDVNFTLQ